jgi:hypothetical protein
MEKNMDRHSYELIGLPLRWYNKNTTAWHVESMVTSVCVCARVRVGACMKFSWRSQGKETQGRLKCKLEDDIKTGIREIDYEG